MKTFGFICVALCSFIGGGVVMDVIPVASLIGFGGLLPAAGFCFYACRSEPTQTIVKGPTPYCLASHKEIEARWGR